MTSFISRFAAVVVATVAVAGIARADEFDASPYGSGTIVSAIVKNQLSQMQLPTQEEVDASVFYVVGFTSWIDSRCDFLSRPAFDKLNGYLTTAFDAGNAPNASAQDKLNVQNIAQATADAKIFLAEHGCARNVSRAAMATLKRAFETDAPRANPQADNSPAARPATRHAPRGHYRGRRINVGQIMRMIGFH